MQRRVERLSEISIVVLDASGIREPWRMVRIKNITVGVVYDYSPTGPKRHGVDDIIDDQKINAKRQ